MSSSFSAFTCHQCPPLCYDSGFLGPHQHQPHRGFQCRPRTVPLPSLQGPHCHQPLAPECPLPHRPGWRNSRPCSSSLMGNDRRLSRARPPNVYHNAHRCHPALRVISICPMHVCEGDVRRADVHYLCYLLHHLLMRP